MTNERSRVRDAVLEGIKAVLRPPYRAVQRTARRFRVAALAFSQGIPDTPSVLAIGRFGGFDVAYRRGTADESVIEHSFDHDIFFAGVPEYRPAPGDVIIDIGAHIGTFSLLASSKVGDGRVLAVEASQDTFNLLRINVALNRAENISAHHLAMAGAAGPVTLHHDTGNWGHTTVKALSGSSETVEGITLSAFMRDNGVDACAFVKFNCEGAEFPVLMGTPTDVLERIGAMVVLYHGDLWEQHTEAELIAHLEAAGFDCAVRNRTDRRGWIVATRPAPEGVADQVPAPQ